MKKMKSFMDFVEENDSFGSEKKFKINGKEKFQTFLGGFLNFSILFIFLYKFFSSFIQFLSGEGPGIAIAEDIDPNPLTYNKGEYLLSITPSKSFGFATFNLTEYFYVNAFEYNFFTDKPTPLDFREENNTLNFFIPQNRTVNLTGSFGDFENELNVLMISFDFCKYFIEKGKWECKDPEAFKNLIHNSPQNLFYLTHSKQIFNSENYTYPFKEKQVTEIILNSLNIFKRLFMEIQNVVVESETVSMLGISDSVKRKTTTSISDNIIFSDEFDFTKPGFKNSYFSLIISKTSTSKKFLRKYPFIDELIGDAAVLTTWISVIIGFFYTFYNDQRYKNFLFEKLVNFNDKKIHITKISKNELQINVDPRKKEKSQNFNADNENSKIANDLMEENNNIIELSNLENPSMRQINNIENFLIEQPPNNLRKYDITEKDAKIAFDGLTSEKEKNNLSYYDYLLTSLNCRKNKIYQKVEHISEKLEAKLDILHYFKNLKNMKLIESLLLEKNQKNILKLISKKIYSVYSSEVNDDKQETEKISPVEFKKIIDGLDQTEKMNIKILRELFELEEN